MKKLYASLLTGLLLAAATLAAQAQTIRRVNNSGITGTNIYATVQLAHDAAVTGDIIQVEPSSTSYGTLSCSKNVTIVGPGYFLGSSQNPGLQANPTSATLGSVYFTTGSAGASISGLTLSDVYIGTSNITVQRNYTTSWLYVGYATTGQSNLNIRQNYLYGMSYYNYTANNVLVTNNIIYGNSVNLQGCSGEFTNNVGLGTVSLDNFNVRNNYFANTFTPSNNIYSYNISAQAGFSTANNNQNNVPQASVFALAPGSTQFDAWYQLKAGTNPARGTGQGGTDIGAFGGNTPYKLSGLPAIPSIYQFNQTLSGNTLNVNLSTRSNN
ncbi:hypothetical protein F0P96_11415 [Hymenobacter busanensis]|uniref:Uncharacterized protein n=1 Tax=Hymenobacter busanensis TaxID=2607656 RepID=A0A7L4ZZK8_9BACT|nr:hypothetical protein [Hymenobacter busanensis]KAA9332089.1 hypothetical protein F0P96_11415 [Hymenobacter busanensis]QHJ07572.1 hypothetical protein GUY19_09855 [Hymenobacter busanensis]